MDYSKLGTLEVSMMKYIDSIIGGFPELIEKSSCMPHTENLFKVYNVEEAHYLIEEMGQAFHTTVTQLLLLSC